MKSKIFVLGCVLAGLIVALVLPMNVAATGNVLVCTGEEYRIAFIDPGTWTYMDDRIKVRGMMMQYEEVASCGQASGVNTVVMNANWDANMTGPIWGTSHSETLYNGGGVWEGSWAGKVNPDGSSAYRATVLGVSGSVKGLVMQVQASSTPGGFAQVTFTIFNP